jgi:hypothetical protein
MRTYPTDQEVEAVLARTPVPEDFDTASLTDAQILAGAIRVQHQALQLAEPKIRELETLKKALPALRQAQKEMNQPSFGQGRNSAQATAGFNLNNEVLLLTRYVQPLDYPDGFVVRAWC